MGMWVGRGRKARAAYGFDDIALVPGSLTINPNEVDISWELCGRRFQIPIMAAAMDGVVSPKLAIEMGRLGGLAVLNLEGIFARYENPDEVIDRITSASLDEATKIIQGIYGEPIKEELIHKRISEIKKGGGPVMVSAIPQRAERFAKIAEEAGADFFVVQSTVTTARHVATEYTPMDLRELKKHLSIPLIVGNTVTYEACLEGTATAHSKLPRTTRIRVGMSGPLEQMLFGPAVTEDGTLNLVRAIRTCMGSVGAMNIKELQQTELIIAPSIKTEGKVFQR